MKNLIVYIIILIAASACHQQSKPAVRPSDKAAPVADAVQYTCPMHPDVISRKPGVCPKCGMDLVEKE